MRSGACAGASASPEAGLQPRRPAPLHPALAAELTGARAAPDQAHEPARRPPSPLRLPADLGAFARRGLRGQPQADREALAAGGPSGPAADQEPAKEPGERDELLDQPRASHPNQIWSYDFVAARTANGGPLRILNVVDEYTRLCIGGYVARSIGAQEVAEQLGELFARHGQPQIIRSDNGREFTADSLAEWLRSEGVAGLIDRGAPQQNPYVERSTARCAMSFSTARSCTRCSKPGSSSPVRHHLQRDPPAPRPRHAHPAGLL